MAGAKLKEGLDYYPSTTRADQKFRIIKALYGNDGYVILDYLLKDIYGEKGYFIKWSERMAKFFASEHGFNFDTVKAVVTDCLCEGIFDKEKFEDYQILTSKEIQNVWIHVAKERKVVMHVKEYLVIDIQPFLKSGNKTAPVNNTNSGEGLQGWEPIESAESISSGINCKNPPDNRQSKVKQSEAEETEVKEKKEKNTDFFSLSANISPLVKNEEIFFQKKIDTLNIKPDKPSEKSENPEDECFSKEENPNVVSGNAQIIDSEKPKKSKIISSIELLSEDHSTEALNLQSAQNTNSGKAEFDTCDEAGSLKREQEKGKSQRIFGITEILTNQENLGQTVIREILSCGEKSESTPEPGKQGMSCYPKEPEKSDTGKSGTKAKSGKEILRVNKPHPVRPFIIKLWEDKFGQPYPNSFKGNMAIKGVIRHLEGLIKRSRKDLLVSEEEINNQIVELWKVILHNWDKLDKFYRSMITFERIEKYLAEIINQLKVNGTERIKSSPNGAKPSFDRFRKKYG